MFGRNKKTKDRSRRTERRCFNVQRASYRRSTGEKIKENKYNQGQMHSGAEQGARTGAPVCM